MFEKVKESGGRWDISSLHLERKRKFLPKQVFICCKSIPGGKCLFLVLLARLLAVNDFIVCLITL